jgi:hypothetical protein
MTEHAVIFSMPGEHILQIIALSMILLLQDLKNTMGFVLSQFTAIDQYHIIGNPNRLLIQD